ncbi:MAG: hypothetical protein VKL01_01335 [Limnothrix sp.]|nr:MULTISPECIES: hypothetical protein [unclassified Limnothrix]MBD2161745.1 hypothetical protein [Limnothrix sp. FACHB-1083]MBD2192678.1 hypothetical protein [Limnothrix sp. FACHB-1088]MEB3116980.1 hypothetical protein [Limnothrix sp.]
MRVTVRAALRDRWVMGNLHFSEYWSGEGHPRAIAPIWPICTGQEI